MLFNELVSSHMDFLGEFFDPVLEVTILCSLDHDISRHLKTSAGIASLPGDLFFGFCVTASIISSNISSLLSSGMASKLGNRFNLSVSISDSSPQSSPQC